MSNSHTHNNSYEGVHGEHLCNVSVEVTGYAPMNLAYILDGPRTTSTQGGKQEERKDQDWMEKCNICYWTETDNVCRCPKECYRGVNWKRRTG